MDCSTLQAAPGRLATVRLELVQPRAEHAAVVAESVNASLQVLQFITWGQQPFDVDGARRFCVADAERVAAGDCLIYFVFERESGLFVGNLDLHTFHYDAPRCQIGYVGDARRAGRGLMREAALALMDLGYGLGLERIEAWCDTRNTRSIHFARTLGMQPEGVMRAVERDPQRLLCDQMLLARLRSDPPPP